MKKAMYPFLLSLLFVVVLIVMGVHHAKSLITLGIGFLGLAIIIAEIISNITGRMKSENNTFFSSVAHIFKINTRRYSGYLIHFGVILIYLAIVGTTVYKHEKEITLQQGEETKVGDYRLVYNKMGDKRDANKDVLTAELDVFKGTESLGKIVPQRFFYHSATGKTQYTTEVAVRSTLKEDLYVILASYQDDGSATFTFLVNPLQIWMWIGGIIITIGVIIILIHSGGDKKSNKPEKISTKRKKQ